MDNYWQTEHTGDYSCLTITTLLFIIVLSISLYITYEPRRDLAILPDQRKTVFPRTVRRVQCVSLGGGWVVSAWSTVLRGILRPYITAPRERRHWRLNLGGAGRRTGRSGCRSCRPCFRQAAVGEEWQKRNPLLLGQSPIKCSLRWTFFSLTIETFFPKWWERATFFIWITNENVPKKMNLGFGAGLWLSRLD